MVAQYVILRDLLVKEDWRILTDLKVCNSICGYEGFVAFRPKSLVFGIAVVCLDCHYTSDHAVSKAVGTKAR